MKFKPLSIIKFILILALAGLLLFLAFRGISISKIIEGIMEANFFWLFISVMISVIALFSRAYRWKLLIEPLGYSPALKNTFYALMVGYFANLAFPRLGEVTRCGTLRRSESIPFAGLIGTVIVERAIDVLSLLICIILTGSLEYKRLGNYLSVKIIHPIEEKLKYSFTSPLIIVGFMVVLIFLVFIIYYLKKRSKAKGKDGRLVHFIKDLVKGLKSIAYLKHPWQFVNVLLIFFAIIA